MFKIGDRVKVTGNNNHHNYTIGEVYTIKDIGSYGCWRLDKPGGNHISSYDMVLVKEEKKMHNFFRKMDQLQRQA